MATLISIVLAGGTGSRLWPVSREFYPKQLMNLVGDDSLLQRSARRAAGLVGAERVLTITSESHYFTVLDQIREVDEGLTAGLLCEPTARGTAAAAALAALSALESFEDAILWFTPADQLIAHPEVLEAGVKRAAEAAQDGAIVALGLPEARLHWGLDLIRLAPAGEEGELREVTGWDASPAPDTVAEACQHGDAVWNSGIFVARADTLLEALTHGAPDFMATIRSVWETRNADAKPVRVARGPYAELTSIGLGEVLVGQWGQVRVLPIDPGWSHVGSWMGLWESAEKDAKGNAVQGDVILEDSSGCLVRSDGRLVACAGVSDLAIIETADAVLVADKRQAGAIRTIVKRLKAAGRSEATNHLKDLRPWGSFSVLLEGPRYKIKEILVKAGASLSMQMHYHRSEHWVVIEGTAKVTRGDDTELLSENQSTYIPVGTRHRLENPGRMPLRIVEVQNGSYVGEDDIVRFEDRYGRES